MKKLCLLALVCLFSVQQVFACRCALVSLTQDFQRADRVFIGTVVDYKVGDKAYYRFKVEQVFKGSKIDTITILTNVSSAACGSNFEKGKKYVIFSNDGFTNLCRRNALASNSHDLTRLRYMTDEQFSASLGKDKNPNLTKDEAAYLNETLYLQLEQHDFRFNRKKVAFFSDSRLIDKETFFHDWGGKEIICQLMILTPTERKKSRWIRCCYHHKI